MQGRREDSAVDDKQDPVERQAKALARVDRVTQTVAAPEQTLEALVKDAARTRRVVVRQVS